MWKWKVLKYKLNKNDITLKNYKFFDYDKYCKNNINMIDSFDQIIFLNAIVIWK